MSTHDSGAGGQNGRPPVFQPNYAEGLNATAAPAANTQKNEVAPMVQGAGRPGQPNVGQRSIFGNGGPTFTQMPTYTPVTRSPERPEVPPQVPPQAQPQQPAAPVYQPGPQGTPQPAAYAPVEPAFQPPQPQAYAGNQPPQPQIQPQVQTPAPGAQRSPAFEDLPDLSGADPAFPDSIFGDFQADVNFDPDLSGLPPGAPGHPVAGHPMTDQPMVDASFPEPGPASFQDPGLQEAGYPAVQPTPDAHFDVNPGAPAAQAPMQSPENYNPQPYPAQQPGPPVQQPFPPAQGAVQGGAVHGGAVPGHGAVQGQAVPYGEVPPPDPSRQLQAFDSVYDQPPQIALGGAQSPVPQPQELFDADRGDADFMDESQVLPAVEKSNWTNFLKGRSAVMVASALLGALAFGGALAVALEYWQGGGSLGGGETPIVTADATPVKEVPDQPGGKEFPHKNKLIYDRLTNGDTPESERLVPRQEDVAVPALPPANATAGLPTPVATTDLANPATTQSLPGAAGEDGGPRKVKTLVVRPDGSVEAPAVADAANAANTAANAAVAGAAATANQAVAGASAAANNAVGQAANVMPVPPVQAPAAPQQVAAADPAAAPAAAPADAKYVVQLGSNKSQTDALASFADVQQKHASLLGSYQPIVRKADLGAKGIWYRLQVGPMADKDAAYKLCGQLKSQGHGDCLVMAQ